jgi:hypothetical protein
MLLRFQLPRLNTEFRRVFGRYISTNSQLLSDVLDRPWNIDFDWGLYRLYDMEIRLGIGVTSRQGMHTPSRHLICVYVYTDPEFKEKSKYKKYWQELKIAY